MILIILAFTVGVFLGMLILFGLTRREKEIYMNEFVKQQRELREWEKIGEI